MGYGLSGSFMPGQQRASYGGGGDDELSQLLKALSGMGGGVSPWLSLGTQFGGSLLNGLASLIGGKSAEQKSRETQMGDIQGLINRGPQRANMGGYLANVRNAITPEVNRTASNAANRVGLDSGVAQSEIMRSIAAPMAGAAANYQQNWDLNQQQQLMQLRQLLAALASGGR